MEMWQLQQLQGLPLEVKIRKTQERIKEWYEHYNGSVYVSFSGGKDSTVLLHIAREMYPEIEAVFVDTGLEYPEIREFVKGFENVTWLKPKINFKEVIEKYGFPVISKSVSNCIRGAKKGQVSRIARMNGESNMKSGKKSKFNFRPHKYLLDAPFEISEECCDVIKKKPCKEYEKASEKRMITGEMANESMNRQAEWLQNGCNGFELGRPKSTPISFWTEQDIFNYLQLCNLSIASCYGEIIEGDQLEGQTVLDGCMSHLTTSKCKRTGCMFCMFGVHLEKEPNRFQMMKETHPKQYDYCINKLGLGEVLDYIKVKY
jgi:3'-phosphoadenosine 5'-phosphosulfate sulfotransferase (PAPS reductase)/FAD synthetase